MAERNVWSANALRMLLIGGAGVIALLWLQSDAEPLVVIRTSALILGFGVSVTMLVQVSRIHLPLASFRQYAPENLRNFVRYGLPRGLVSGLDTLIALVGPWLLRDKPEQAGYLIIAYSLLRVMDAAILPAMQAVATAAARAMGAGNDALMTRAVRLAVGAATVFGTLAIAFLLPWLNPVLHLWLGNEVMAHGSYEYAKWITIGILPLCMYLTLRQIIEIRYITPFNLVSNLCGLAILICCYYAGKALGISEYASLITGLLAMEVTRGFLSLIWVREDLRDLAYFGFTRLIISAFIIGIIQTLAAKSGSLLIGVIALLISGTILYLLLFRYPARIVVDLLGQIVRARA